MTRKELKSCPIDFDKFRLKEKKKDKYLGQVIQSTLADSALATVQDREGKIKGAAIEFKSIIKEFQMQALAGAMAAWELCEHALLPSLLSGAGTWLGEIQEAVDLCDSIQNFFWRLILEVPLSCPKVALRSETKSIGMKWKVWEAKCLLLKQIQNLEDTALAKRVCLEADARNLPGLMQEVRQICHEIGINDINKSNVSNSQIKDAIFYSHYKEMKEELGNSSKLQDIQHEDYREIQSYFKEKSIEDTRFSFRIRTKLLINIPGNCKNMYKNNKPGLKCSHCTEEVMTQVHCISCPGMTQMRDGLELDKIEDMVVYFRRILKAKDRK